MIVEENINKHVSKSFQGVKTMKAISNFFINRRYILQIVLGVIMVSTIKTTASSQIESGNNDYWFVMPDLRDPSSSGNGSYYYGLDLVSDTTVTVRCESKDQSFLYTISSAGKSIEIGGIFNGLNGIFKGLHKTVKDFGIHVYSLDGKPFTASLRVGPEEAYATTYCLPTSALGTCYRIASYDNIDSLPGKYTPPLSAKFSVVGTQDSTHVAITFPQGSGLSPLYVTLNAWQVYYVGCGKHGVNIDPTGTLITSDRAIAVFAAHDAAMIPGGHFSNSQYDGYVNALFQEMTPLDAWGTIHNAVSTPTQQSQNNYRFIADQDSTLVFIDNVLFPPILNAGQFSETVLSGGHEIYSTKPIEVVQYMQSGPWLNGGDFRYLGIGGPAMFVVPPVDRYFFSTRYFIFDYTGHLGGDLPTDRSSTLVIIAADTNKADVELDGTLLDATKFIPIPQSIFNPVKYSYYIVDNILVSKSHTLRYNPIPPTLKYSLSGYVTAVDNDRDESTLQNIGYRNPKPLLSIPKKVDYGVILCDTEKIQTVTLRNIGTAALTLLAPTGFSGTEFTLVSPTFPYTINPGDSLECIIKFSSVTPGIYNATLVLATNEQNCKDAIIVEHPISFIARKERAEIVGKPTMIDFGDVSCGTIDTTITLTNTGTVKDTITSETFSNWVGIAVVSPGVPFNISIGATQKIRIRLNVDNLGLGLFTSTLHLLSKPCNLSADFNFTARKKELAFVASPDKIDFGITAKGKTRSATFTFANPNNATVRISDISFSQPLLSGQVTTPATLPLLVGGNTTTAIGFNVTLPDTSRYDGTICVTVDSPCSSKLCMPISIEGSSVCPQVLTSATAGKNPGEFVTMPIIVSPSTKFTATTSIGVSVHYDGTLLRIVAPPSSSIGKVVLGVQSTNELSFRITPNNALTSPEATIADLHFQTLLAQYATGLVDVRASTFTLSSGEVITGTSCPSGFTLDSSCVLPSNLKTRSSAELGAIYPNPTYSATRVRIVTHGNPAVIAEVLDTFGRRAATLWQGELPEGEHELEINTEHYANGLYFVRLTHRNVMSTKAFNVQH